MNPLPEWQESGSGWQCSDPEQNSFAVLCSLRGFNLPAFDLWLSALDACKLRTDCLERRQLALQSKRDNNQSEMWRHLEFLKMAQQLEQREDFLLPLAKAQTNIKDKNKATAKRPRPSRRDPLKQSVQRIMRDYKADGATLDDFLRIWVREKQGYLVLTKEGIAQRHDRQKYRITDTTPGETDGSGKVKTFSTLRDWWATSIKSM